MGRFPKYKLTEKQIRGIANIVAHEQGSLAGRYAEASQIANRTDIRGDRYATGDNAVKTVTSGWYAKGRARYNAGTSNKQCIEIVKKVFCDGFRTLPRYIDEHDCMSDIATVKNGKSNVKWSKAKWKRHETIIHNKMSSTYIFYDFPGGYRSGVDPFGYTNKKMREKWGDFCYTVSEAVNGKREPSFYGGVWPVLPDESFGVKRQYYKYGDGNKTLKKYPTQIKRVQEVLAWAGYYNGEIDGIFGKLTKEAVNKFRSSYAMDENGRFDQACIEVLRTLKK